MINVELSGCAIIRNNDMLLLKKFKNDYFELPGGKVDADEEIVDAAIREVKEEIGCNVKIIKNLGYYDFAHKEKNVRSNIFLAETDNEPKIVENEVFESIIWMPIKEYEKYKLAPNVEWLCKELCKNKL